MKVKQIKTRDQEKQQQLALTQTSIKDAETREQALEVQE
jgi:hypothetical protein